MSKSERYAQTCTTVEAILSSLEVSAAWQAYCDGLAQLDIHHVVYGSTRMPSWGIIANGHEALILHHGPQGYADSYLGEELFLDSPTYRWAEKNDGFTSWHEAIATQTEPPTARQRRIMELNAQYGLRAGWVGSLNRLVPGMRGVIGLSPARDIAPDKAAAIWAEIGTEIAMLSRLMHLRVASLPQNIRRPLTSRQREALAWCAEGKTMQDVATIMDLSIATVEKHLRMARVALDATTTAHAVQKAMALNLLNRDTG